MKLPVWELEGGEEVYCGDYEFSTLPARDDRIIVKRPDWGPRWLKVLYLVHRPDLYGPEEDDPIIGLQTCVSIVGERDQRAG